MGLQGINTARYVDSKAEVGTIAHYLIGCDLRCEKPDLSDYAPAQVGIAENPFLKWLEWKSGHRLEFIRSETPLVSEQHRYGGTIDVYCWLDNQPTLLDIKTSGSGIWPEMRHQLAAYRQLLIEAGCVVGRAMIVRVGRGEISDIQIEQVSNLEDHFQVFLHALEIYRLQKKLNRERG